MSKCVLLDEYKYNLAAAVLANANQLDEQFEYVEQESQGNRLFEQGGEKVKEDNLQFAIT